MIGAARVNVPNAPRDPQRRGQVDASRGDRADRAPFDEFERATDERRTTLSDLTASAQDRNGRYGEAWLRADEGGTTQGGGCRLLPVAASAKTTTRTALVLASKRTRAERGAGHRRRGQASDENPPTRTEGRFMEPHREGNKMRSERPTDHACDLVLLDYADHMRFFLEDL